MFAPARGLPRKGYLPWPPLLAEPCPLEAADAAPAVLDPEDIAGEPAELAPDTPDDRAAETELAVPVAVPAIGV